MHAYHYREAWYWHRPDRPRRHVVVWVDPHSGRRTTRAFPTKRQAREFRRWIDRQLNQPLYGPDDPTWEDLIGQYDQIKADASPTHRYTIFRALASFYNVCRPRRLSEITPSQLDFYFAEFTRGRVPKRKSTPSERRKDWKALHTFFEVWCRRGLMPANPLRTVEEPKAVEPLVKVPTDQQWAELLRVLPRRDLWLEDPQAWHLYILLAVVTGIDRDDLLNVSLLPRSSPDVITFQLGDTETDGVGLMHARRRKTKKPEIHGLPPVVCDRIAIRISQLPAGTTFLFPWRSFQRKQWDRIRARAHFGFPFKVLRAAACTRAAEAAALEAGRHLLGHSSSRTTRTHYLEMQRVAIATAKRLDLPTLPPFPDYGTPEERKRRLAGKPGRRPAGSG